MYLCVYLCVCVCVCVCVCACVCTARCLAGDANAAVDLLGDILTNASYDAGKVEAERSVILRENQEVNSIPEEVVMDYLHATAFQVGLHAGLRAHTHTHTHIHTHCLSVWSIQLFFVADLRPGSSSPAAAFIAAQTSPLGYTILGPEENIKCVFHCPADRESATCCVHCRCCSHCHHALHCTALSCADTRGVSCRAFFFCVCCRSITRDDLVKYVETYYTGPRMVLVGTGGVDHDQLVDAATKAFGGLSADDKTPDVARGEFHGSEVRTERWV